MKWRDDLTAALFVIAAQIVGFVVVMCALAIGMAALLSFAGIPR